MPSNIEIKAYLGTDTKRRIEIETAITGLDGVFSGILEQEDTFFSSPNKRLKLRQENNSPSGHLIGYDREDKPGPKRSNFFMAAVPSITDMKDVLRSTVGILAIVHKTRNLYMIYTKIPELNNQTISTRVHMDKVRCLGDFVEIEVIIGKESEVPFAVQLAEKIMNALNIHSHDLVSSAYVDLLIAKG